MFEDISSTTLFIYLIVLLLSIISITLLVLLVHSGLFYSVKDVGTGNPPIGRVVIAYKFQKGPYNESGQIFTEAHIIAPDNKCLGIYYDDPKKVASNELRYVVGSILATDPSEVDSEIMDQFSRKGYKMMTLPEVEFVVKTSFPHVTTLSILIAIQKAYPRLAHYIEEHKLCAYPFLEYYDGKEIHFLAPLSKQEEFWASECQQQEGGSGEGGVESSDVNTTLDTSHSVLEESRESTPISSPPLTSDLPDTPVTAVDSTKELEVEGKGKGDAPENSEADIDKDEQRNNIDPTEDEDNSSSSSFEVLKNEGGD